ncbi:MAG TPA: hypothetical protein PKK06_01425 [Phycisphaerae bacterium]|nr:hypothetical protein [Phycisphaerae bacterium]HNU46641.1 hypothetical protein [Phycisphaerae bacterium]
MTGGETTWLNRCQAELRRSPGRAAVLGVLGVVLVIVVAAQFVRWPSSAVAATAGAEVPPTLPAPPGAVGTVDAGAPSAPVPGTLPVARRAAPPVPRTLGRDPFALDWERFVPPTPAEQTAAAPAQPEPEEEELVLEATFRANPPQAGAFAVINGATVGLHDQVGRYVVLEIGTRHVVLGDRDRRLLLRMP